jgi:hypothetical protein
MIFLFLCVNSDRIAKQVQATNAANRSERSHFDVVAIAMRRIRIAQTNRQSRADQGDSRGTPPQSLHPVFPFIFTF